MNKKLIYGAFAFAALGFASCSSDEPVNGGVAQKDEVRYLRVNLMNPKATRAAEFDAGTDAENKIESIIMVFYDAAGNEVSRALPNDINWAENPGTVVPNVGEIGTAVVTVEIQKNENLPSYVVCYLNPVDYGSNTAADKTMQGLRIMKREFYKDKAGTGNFAMNNSCYYGNDPISGGANVFMSGTPIVASNLFTSREDAADPDNDNVVDIYVERYAAKVNFSIDNGIDMSYSGVTDITEGDDKEYTLEFTPEAWVINAASNDMFAIKNFSATAFDDPIPTLQNVDSYLGGWRTWNDPTNNRSYWACSPSFFASEFPRVSDDIIDLQTTGTGAGTVTAPYALKYYSYNQITGATNNPTISNSKGFTTSDVVYTLENTMGKAAYASLNPKAAAPSVVMVGNYKVTYNETEVPAGTDFYIYNNGLYFKNAVAGITDPLMINKMIDMQQILYKKNSDGTFEVLTETNAPTGFVNQLTIEHPSKAVRGENLVPQRFVALQISSLAGYDQIYYRPNGDNTPQLVTNENLSLVNRLLWQQVGVAECYTQGKAFYSIPIWHLGMTENNVDKPFVTDKEGNYTNVIDWEKLRIGDMGLVRNHTYKLDVKSITGRAAGITDLDNPLVPQMDQDNYYIKYRINVLNWRIVPTQEVEL